MLTADTLIHVCDSETTGLKVEDGDRIIQIAAVTGTANGGISDRYSAILD
ncbi:exonuclease domain-containing protein, partial [Acinetobacter baumannii]